HSLPNSTLSTFPTRRSSDLTRWQNDVLRFIAPACRFQSARAAHLASKSHRRRLGRTNASARAYQFRRSVELGCLGHRRRDHVFQDRKSTRLNSSHVSISYAV